MRLEQITPTEMWLLDENGNSRNVKIEQLDNNDQTVVVPLIQWMEENNIGHLSQDVPQYEEAYRLFGKVFDHEYQVGDVSGHMKQIDRVSVWLGDGDIGATVYFTDGDSVYSSGSGYHSQIGVSNYKRVADDIGYWFRMGNNSVLTYEIIRIEWEQGKEESMTLRGDNNEILYYEDGKIRSLDQEINNPRLLRAIKQWFANFKQQLDYLMDGNEMAFEASRK